MRGPGRSDATSRSRSSTRSVSRSRTSPRCGTCARPSRARDVLRRDRPRRRSRRPEGPLRAGRRAGARRLSPSRSVQAPSRRGDDPAAPVHAEPADRGRQRLPGRGRRPVGVRGRGGARCVRRGHRGGAGARAAGVRVHLFDDRATGPPDSVFPNNWFSTHADGHMALYPMYSPNRRGERRCGHRRDAASASTACSDVIDYSGLEHDEVFLEGTGAMVLDHAARVAYVARSHRADPIALERFCSDLGYEPSSSRRRRRTGSPIYHTNVMMGVATEFALVGLDPIASTARARSGDRAAAAHRADDRRPRPGQLGEFAGNAIELRRRPAERLLAISSRAVQSLADGSAGGHRAQLPDPGAGRSDHRARRRFRPLHDRGDPPGPEACGEPARLARPDRFDHR